MSLQDNEQYRMQMAGISTAALGYWKEGDEIHPDYDTPALREVAQLYAKYAALADSARVVDRRLGALREIAALNERDLMDGERAQEAVDIAQRVLCDEYEERDAGVTSEVLRPDYEGNMARALAGIREIADFPSGTEFKLPEALGRLETIWKIANGEMTEPYTYTAPSDDARLDCSDMVPQRRADSAPGVARHEPSPDQACSMIEAVLRTYRCTFTRIGEPHEEAGIPLVDKLTPPDETTIKRGEEELALLAEHLYDSLPPFRPEYFPPERIEPSPVAQPMNGESNAPPVVGTNRS